LADLHCKINLAKKFRRDALLLVAEQQNRTARELERFLKNC
jgi:hypothetical protein